MQQTTSRESSEPQSEPSQVEESTPEAAPVAVPVADLDTRILRRMLRRPAAVAHMPESEIWRAYMELSRRGEPQATELFLLSLKGLHRRRAMGGSNLPCADPSPDEHRLVEDPYVGELWKAYKRCISQGRPGPASALLRDLEQILVR
ncbi:MAG: hypothetical protein ACI9VR_001173 [Cognaticolwellia sp.]|jgi:hypothetical protein